jgi:hypothetical protein
MSRFGTMHRLGILLALAGCKTAPPVTASARLFSEPVLVGPVQTLGGTPRADWGPGRGVVEIEVGNEIVTNAYTRKTGSERFGLVLLGQAQECPKCVVRIQRIYLRSGAGLAASNRIEIEGDLRPAPERGGSR